LHFAPPAPFEASAARPPQANARRRRFTGIPGTRNRFAIFWSLADGGCVGHDTVQSGHPLRG
jgi:hypothetical protein